MRRIILLLVAGLLVLAPSPAFGQLCRVLIGNEYSVPALIRLGGATYTVHPGQFLGLPLSEPAELCVWSCPANVCAWSCTLTACPRGVYTVVPAAIPKGLEFRVDNPGTCGPCRDETRRLDVNNLNMVVMNDGAIAWNPSVGLPGFEYPRGTGKTAVFAGGLWVGGIAQGETLVTVAEYSQEYTPGVMTGPNSWMDPTTPAFKPYKVAAFTGNPDDTTFMEHHQAEIDADPNLDWVIHHAWQEYMLGAAPFGAPVRSYLDGAGGTFDGPVVDGDLMIWSVYHDADPARHFNDAGRTPPIGIEVQQTAFAWNRRGDLGNRLFVRYRIVNRGFKTLTNAYIGLWMDPDLGGFTDDMIGSDIGQGLGFCYNANDSDAVYGNAPPAVGVRWVEGAKVPGGRLGMTALTAFRNGTDPRHHTESYNLMQGLNRDGTPMIDPTTSLPTKFQFNGDPVTGTGWLDPAASDKRMLASTGPFTLAPGDTQTVLAMILVGQGTDRLSSITALRDLATPTLISLVSAVADRDGVRLRWRAAAGAGARIYRTRGTGASWELAANLVVDGGGDLPFDDHDVVPGARYGYRVGLAGANGSEVLSPEVWLDVPPALELALQGFRPNPAVGVPTIAFTLPRVAKGRIDVIDVLGRRVAGRTLDGVAPGRHLMRLDDAGPLPPGIYLVRLTHGPRVLTARAVVLR